MRFITGGIMHETHSFSSDPVRIDTAPLARGEELLAYAGTNHSVGGVIDECATRGIELVPTFYHGIGATGPASPDLYNQMRDELLERIAAALPADGIVLTLHGAMVVAGYPDVEADIVQQVRMLAGATPIAVTLDFHANIGQEMVSACSVVTVYDTYPHIDAADRAREAVAVLARTVKGEITPAMALVKPPLLPVPQAQYTSQPPLATLFEVAFGYENRGKALSVSIAGGFPYSDIPMAGMSFLAITDNDAVAAERIVNDLASRAWEMRESFIVQNVPAAEAVAEAIAFDGGLVVLADVGDNIGAGTPGDGTVLLAELLHQGARETAVAIADAEAVEVAQAAGIGGAFAFPVGGKLDDLHGDPVKVEGEVVFLGDGHWVHEGPENAGVPFDMGPTAVVRAGGVNVILTSRKTMPGDLQQLRSVGIEPTEQRIIVVKSAVRWRGGYGPITAHSIDVDTPGLTTVNLGQLPFAHLRRPIYPLDLETVWSGELR
ncbi:MAG: M81 family metallopeptidase [Thermomicrobiales bacterium]